MAARTFLITGATKGIGRALSERLVRTGHEVIGLVRESADFSGELAQLNLADRGATAAALQDLIGRHAIDGVVNNVGLVTVLGMVQRTAYAAAKSALVSFARSGALEPAETGITVNAVAPGPTETELFRANNARGSEGEQRYLAALPMKRLGQPDEIAAAISFLFSEDAGFITGQTLYVDGGASIGKASF